VNLELLPAAATARGGAVPVVWGGSGPSALRTTIDPWFTSWGTLTPAGVGLGRIGTAVFLADRMARRPQRTLARDLRLVIHVPDPSVLAPTLDPLVEVLRWVTGDTWAIELVPDRTAVTGQPVIPALAKRIGLLSGGLDSYCGAILSHTGDIAYLGHGDASNVRTAQNGVIDWFHTNGVTLDMETVWLMPPVRTGREPTRRSRASFFVLLAAALADAKGAEEIEIPENGFTSINPPLGPNRGGVWTTRSTHPRTLALLNEVLDAASMAVTLVNPYELYTKGELVAAARQAATAMADFDKGLAATQSCAKADGRFFGGSPSDNCGLCFACIVRRGGTISAVGSDPTTYLVDSLPPPKRDLLIARRRADINAVRSIVHRGVTKLRLAVSGPFADTPFDDVHDLCERSLKELGGVPLP